MNVLAGLEVIFKDDEGWEMKTEKPNIIKNASLFCKCNKHSGITRNFSDMFSCILEI